MLNTYNLGIDIGSTTLKVALYNANREEPKLLFFDYRRHNADVNNVALKVIRSIRERVGECRLRVVVTGSVGMGFAERLQARFVQEVVASVETINTLYPQSKTFIDIGGEDSKMIFFEEGKVPDIRMNGSCAGGTGAFIDQTATLLGVDTAQLNDLAKQSTTIYPIASRCGVFSKTDIQNLIASKAEKSDIAASVFHAVAMQVVGSLARGMEIKPKLFFCGGPFQFLPEVRKAFLQILSLQEKDCIIAENAQLIPATGCALIALKTDDLEAVEIGKLIELIENSDTLCVDYSLRLPQLFATKTEYEQWLQKKRGYELKEAKLNPKDKLYLGVDSGSTTTKIVLINDKGELVYTDYQRNNGDSFNAFREAISRMQQTLIAQTEGIEDIDITASCATGYGEALLRTAFGLDYGIVETMAHYMGGKSVIKDVSFVLDIGGQDMKAIWARNGQIERIEINEACSSGCGSFIETFARQLGYTVEQFAEMSCFAQHPCDLGTRCTVFMNSKVKQAMREGSRAEDIAAGFSYSVVKNCLYKVLKLKDISDLGKRIVVQGGTFRNHSVVRALELLTGVEVAFTNKPELMGAYGAALHAKTKYNTKHNTRS